MIADQTVISNWHIQENTLVQTASTVAEHRILNRASIERFDFSATMRIRQHKDETIPAFGILMQYSEQEELQVCFLKQQARWGLAIETANISPVVNHVLSLPATFDPATWHTLRLVQQPEQTIIYLDGQEMLSMLETAQPAQPGLMTTNTSAEFTDIRRTAGNA